MLYAFAGLTALHEDGILEAAPARKGGRGAWRWQWVGTDVQAAGRLQRIK